jgi:hypothetical protein
MMMLTTRIAPLCDGGLAAGKGYLVGLVGFELRKRSPPVWLRASDSERYNASLYM